MPAIVRGKRGGTRALAKGHKSRTTAEEMLQTPGTLFVRRAYFSLLTLSAINPLISS